jgi:hypothetical protein
MAVEIFIEPELENLEIAENAAEWFELCSQLGLDKQLQHADKSEEKKAPPYMYVDPKTSAIIRTLCPVQVDYKKYKSSTIPLDVLKEIKKAEDNGWYSKIHICYDDASPDPFVIGITKSESTWDANIHLIARWGPELLPFEQLEIKAIERLKSNAEDALKELKFKIENALSNVEGFIKSNIGKSNDQLPNLNFSIQSINKWS